MSSNAGTQEIGAPRPRVSLILTVRDEAAQLPELLTSIASQTLAPSEVIVVDGGSTDDTLAILERWQSCLPLTVISRPGANISTGRNLAIERANHDIVAVTDAGVRLDSDWLVSLVAPFQQSLIHVDAVGGFFVPDPRTSFETALAATTLPDADEIDPNAFLPSSRSFAFRRSWFLAGARYPEWLDYCEDLIFDLRLKGAGARVIFQPKAIVQFRPRRSLQAFWRQYYHYARGDGRAGLFLKRHLIRYVTYLGLLPSVVITRSPVWRLLVAIAAILYMRQPVRRLIRREGGLKTGVIPLFAMSAFLRAVGDVAKMVGYPVGLLWRFRRYGLRRNWRTIPEPVDPGQTFIR